MAASGEAVPRILVIGAGAIGGVVGAALTRAGQDVTLADVDDAHRAVMQQAGLTIEGYPETHTVPVRAVHPSELAGPYDVAFLAVKSQHTAAALAPVVPHLAADGCIVSLQNGLNEPAIADVVGRERVLGVVIHLAADQVRPGHVVRYGQGEFFLGELDGAITPRCERVQRLMALVAPTTVVDNVWGWLWTKQVYGCLLVASALADEPVGAQLAVPEVRLVHAALLCEATQVALAEGVRLERLDILDPLDTLPSAEHGVARALAALDAVAAGSKKGNSGMWRDIKLKGRKSESEYVTGDVVRRGAARGVPTPVNAAVLRQIGEIEAGQRPMTLANFRELLPLAEAWARRVPV
ncbi:MAG TPA: 2-dehydropantoate 2-reductase [Chloroflexota bacterium]|nr:2-dehydropantoate 2-reductase [Chloroflexota bacterium]